MKGIHEKGLDLAGLIRALSIIRALPERKATDDAVRALAECANRVADSLSELGYDHAGPLYHRILGSAKSDGAFYTNNLSAVMLARLAFTDGFVDWSDPEAVARLRIMDPACGTGTLLMAVLHAVKARVGAGGETGNDALHKRLVEDVLCGLDINRHAIQLAACNMTLGAPTVDYRRMNLVTMPHGPQGDGTVRAGSLEILDSAADSDLRRMLAPKRDLVSLDAAQVNEAEEIDFPLRNLDAVIMNAPFTANENRSWKYGEAGRKAMQLRELGIQRHLELRDDAVRGVVTANSIRTFFSPLADQLLNDSSATLAKVIPTTACTGPSGNAERRFLARRFHVETVVTSHDPRRPNFSENTAIHESLLICRRRNGSGDDARSTRFFSLRKMPSTHQEAIDAAEAIQSGTATEWATVYEQPRERVEKGDWRPCQFLDSDLIRAAMRLEREVGLVPLSSRYQLGPAGRRIRDAFRTSNEVGDDYRVFWSRSKDLRTTMGAIPEQTVLDRKPQLADRYRKQAGHVLVAAKFDTISGRLFAICCAAPALGSMWVPLQAHTTSPLEAKALCAWFNSTPGALGFLMRRGTKLTNPSFSQEDLATICVPDFKVAGPGILAEAFDETKDLVVKPWRNAAQDPMRERVDRAAADTTGIELEEIRDWRVRISREPTISNDHATVP